MKKLFSKLLFSLFLVSTIVMMHAQKADAKSLLILNSVSKKYKSNKNTYFKFTLNVGQNGKITKSDTGLFYTTPTQYNLKVMGAEQIFDGKKVYNISSEDKEIAITKPNGSPKNFSPISYLDAYKKEYNSQYVGKKIVNGKSTELIKLTPIKNNGIKEVHLYVDVKNNLLVKIDQFSVDKSFSSIKIIDYKVNLNLNPGLFTFQKNNYKNYFITEL